MPSTTRVVRPGSVTLELRRVEVHVAKIAGAVALRLVIEVWRLRVAALAACRHRSRLHAVAELHDRDEAVAARAVPFLRVLVRARAERGQRAPARGREAHGNARARIVERLHDVARQTL